MPTVLETLTAAIPRLAEAGVETPRLDAELLLAHVLRQQRRRLWTYPDNELTTEQTVAFGHLIDRRIAREPLAYLLGEWEFYGRPFHVTPEVLIPRPETELLVEAVLVWLRRRGATRVADIGTGSGAIAVTIAAELPSSEVTAVDLSAAALRVARRNAERHDVDARVRCLEGDLLEPLHAAQLPPFDAIVANLPYIAEEEFAGLMPEVRDYEPSSALLASEGGLALIRRVIAESPGLLVPHGLLALEVGQGQAETVADLLMARQWQAIRIIDDYAGIPRHVLGERTA